MMIFDELSQQDREKLKLERRFGYVFAGAFIIFAILFNLVYFLTNKENSNYLLVTIVDVFVLIISYLVCYYANKNVNADLDGNQKQLHEKIIDSKAQEKTHEAGSGLPYIPILADLFPKSFSLGMKEHIKYLLIVKEYKHQVDKETYDNFEVGDKFILHLAPNSGIALNYTKPLRTN